MIINEPEQIKEISARLLATDAVWQSIHVLVEQLKEAAVYNSDATQIRRALEMKLAEPDVGVDARQKYAPIILACYFIGLYNLSPQARVELIQTQTLAALKLGIKARALLEDFLISTEDLIMDKPERPGFFKAYLENQEALGGRSWQEWARNYRAFVKLPTVKRGAMERINFMNFDTGVKSLTLEDKNLLLKALELLDWLEFPDEEKLKANWDMVVAMPDGSEQVMKKTELDELRKKKLPTTGALVPKPTLSQALKPSALPAPSVLQPTAKPMPPAQPVFLPTIERHDAVAEKLIKESGLNVEPELRQRFKMIVVSRLKEVRGWVETRQKLMSPVAQGGMGFAHDEAEKFLKLVESRKEELMKSEIASPRSVVARNDTRPAPPRNDKKTSSDIVKAPPQPLKIVQQEKSAPKIELAPLPPAPIKPAPKIAIPQTPSGRSKMEDVAYKPRLVGPVEELREITLVDFRRLAPQAKVTADKIYAKIELLAEESYEKKILGIKAWQESEVNKMYLGLLNESVDAAKPVQKMIEERQAGGKPTLTYEEFKVVMELNRRLRS